MARHLEGTIKRKFAEADTIIQTCADFLSDSEVQKATSGLAKRALDLLNLLYVPNLKDGAYYVSGKKYGGEAIPFIITDQQEDVRVHRSSAHAIHPLQYEGLRDSFQEVEGQQISETQLLKRVNELRESYLSRHDDVKRIPKKILKREAYVYSPMAWISLCPPVDPLADLDPQELMNSMKVYLTHTSPVVIGKSTSMLANKGDLLFHELVHVDQSLAGKLFLHGSKEERENKCRSELEAYSNQAAALESSTGIKIADGNPHNWNCYSVEVMRRSINSMSDDPYEVSKALLKAVKREGARLV